jgi:hypothetical protein
MMPADGSPSPLRDQSDDRQAFFKKKKKLPLDRTSGAFARVGGRDVLLVIDRRTVDFGTGEWRLIADTAERLEQCHDTLSPQGKAALQTLRAVIFSKKPLRSFADVDPGTFIYDVDEFHRVDGSLVAPAWTASCVVHDANHIWQRRNGRGWFGVDAEVACWELQVVNAGPLGLTDIDVRHLNGFLADPERIVGRANSNPFGLVAARLRQLFRGGPARPPCYLPPPPPNRLT